MHFFKSTLAVLAIAAALIAGPAFAVTSAVPTNEYGHPADGDVSVMYASTAGGCTNYNPGTASKGWIGVTLGKATDTGTTDVFQGTGPVSIRGHFDGLPASKTFTVRFMQLDLQNRCASKGTVTFSSVKSNSKGEASLPLSTMTATIAATSEQPCITYQVVIKQTSGSTTVYTNDPLTHCFSS